MLPPYFIPIIPIRQQVIDMIRNGQHIIGLPPTDILQHLLSILIHTINHPSIPIIDDKELILMSIALLNETDNIYASYYTWHELRYHIALDDVSLGVDWKDAELS